MKEAVIFDMDGTIVDTTRLEYDAWDRMFREQGVEFTYDEYIQVLGAKGSEIVKDRVNETEDKIEQLLDKKEAYFKEIAGKNDLKLIPHVEKLMQEIKNIPLKMALATGASREKMEFVLKKFHIKHFFDAIVTADDVKNGKPDPEVFLKAAQELKVDPKKCIVMEDASNGAEAAKAAGMTCIAITSTRGKNQLQKADVVVNSYQDLTIQDFLA